MLQPIHHSMFWITLIFAILLGQSLAWTGYPNQYPLPGMVESEPSYDMISSLQQNDLYLADIINGYIFHHLQRGKFSNPSGWGYAYSRGPVSDGAYNHGP